MRTLPVLIALALVAGLAGCVNEQESVVRGDGPDTPVARGMSLSVPRDAERLEVTVAAASRGMVSLSVEVEREDRSDLAEDRFTIANGTQERLLDAPVANLTEAWVLVLADGADASVRVSVVALLPEGERLPLRSESFQM